MNISKIDISRYQSMTETPAGAILCHIIKRMNMSQTELSRHSGICPQHINALIKGSRRFSIKLSFALEKALGIEDRGFFFKCQCNYDIRQEENRESQMPNISKLRQSTFWDVNLYNVNWQKGKRWAILRVLEYGTKSDFDEISRFYGRDSFLIELQNLKGSASSAIRRNASLFCLQ